MGTGAEPAKGLLPYLQRADELQKHEPLVAYYCRLYAMEKGLVIPPKDRTKMTNSILVSLINQLEKLEQKQKYAIWKAAEIRKALKEGRKPEAGPPGGDKDEAPDSTTTYAPVTFLALSIIPMLGNMFLVTALRTVGDALMLT
ncbi:hypothetical protein ACQ4PT_009105 [Festuca glaucescens]